MFEESYKTTHTSEKLKGGNIQQFSFLHVGERSHILCNVFIQISCKNTSDCIQGELVKTRDI